MSPGSVDETLVRRHLLALDVAVRQLRGHMGQPVEALDDLDEAWIVERGLQVCAQNCLDIATHLAAGLGHDVADYAAAVDALGRLGVLPAEFAAEFRALAGFRNILVHEYLAVDLAQVHDFLNHRLDDFGTFARHVQTYLERTG